MLDTTLRLPETFLVGRGLGKGDATAVEDAAAFAALKGEAISASSSPPVVSCGGCATNVAKVCAALGVRAVVCGGIGRDDMADVFRTGLAACGLLDATVAADAPTGEVLILVTPDGERSFAYRSGAAMSLTAEGLAGALQERAAAADARLALVYFDVYTLLCPGELLEAGMRQAKSLGARCALNLGSYGIVAVQRSRLWALLRTGLCDALTMNAEEAEALCRDDGDRGAAFTPSEAAERCAAHCALVVLTLGAEGVWAGGSASPPRHFPVARLERIVDSTGAGDFFAGAFLSGWLRELPVEACVRWGACAAAEVLQVSGADLDAEAWARLRERCSASV